MESSSLIFPFDIGNIKERFRMKADEVEIRVVRIDLYENLSPFSEGPALRSTQGYYFRGKSSQECFDHAMNKFPGETLSWSHWKGFGNELDQFPLLTHFNGSVVYDKDVCRVISEHQMSLV